MELKNIISEIDERLFDAMKQAVYEDDSSAGICIETKDGYIDIYINSKGDVEATTGHDDHPKRTSKNINAFIEKHLKTFSWDEAESEVRYESAPTFEEEYAIKGESLFPRGLQWHRI